MNLKQQLLHELRVQNEEAKAAIAKLEDEIQAEYFANIDHHRRRIFHHRAQCL